MATLRTWWLSTAVDDEPSGRGSLVAGSDGTCYYLAHLAGTAADLVDGAAVRTGQVVGFVGDSHPEPGAPDPRAQAGRVADGGCPKVGPVVGVGGQPHRRSAAPGPRRGAPSGRRLRATTPPGGPGPRSWTGRGPAPSLAGPPRTAGAGLRHRLTSAVLCRIGHPRRGERDRDRGGSDGGLLPVGGGELVAAVQGAADDSEDDQR